jgi:hypothetical protein
MDTKKKISKELKAMNEAVDKAQMQRKWDEKLDVAKDVVSQSMPNEDPESVDNIAAKLATESSVVEADFGINTKRVGSGQVIDAVLNSTDEEFLQLMVKIASGRLNQLHSIVGESDGAVSRGIEHGMNPEVQADEYEEYRQLMQQLAAEEGDNANEGMKLNQPTPRTGTARSADSPLKLNQPTPRTGTARSDDNPLKLNQPTPRTDGTARSADSRLKLNQKVIQSEAEGEGETNNPVKLKDDVAQVLAKLDMSSIQPYLAMIDNPTEQAEMIAQFAEMIGVPKVKLGVVVRQLKTVAESATPKSIIRTVKVKDIK